MTKLEKIDKAFVKKSSIKKKKAIHLKEQLENWSNTKAMLTSGDGLSRSLANTINAF